MRCSKGDTESTRARSSGISGYFSSRISASQASVPWTCDLLQLERFHPESAAVPLLDPVQELGQAVDLVVVPPLGELQQFGAEVLEPFCPERQVHVTGLDLGGLGVHPSHF